MNLPEFSIKHKVLINLITAIIIIVGTVSVLQMQREDFPNVQLDYLMILTPYPGASPQEVEELVTIPIEDAIKGVNGINTYSSSSSENISFIFIELDPDLSNRDRVINEIGREVDKVDVPDDVEDSVVEELVADRPLIELSFTGRDVSEDELRGYVKNLEDEIRDIEGIGSIDKIGWRDKEIWVEVDTKNLEEYHVSLAQIIQVIKNQNINLPGGKLKSGSRELIIRTIGELKTAEEFEEVIIRTNSDGRFLRVGDIARVSESFEEQDIIHKTNSKVSINLLPKRKKSSDAITLVDEIKKRVKEYRRTIPDSISIDYVNDFSIYIKRRLSVLVNNGWVGLLMLIIALLFFLNARIALVTAVGIPFSFLAALFMMSLFGHTLNMISMFALILVLGMIVDDAIVVAENTYRHMEEGLSPREAAIKGTSEVMAPVTATILTTIAAFAPLMFIAGMMGKFLRLFPVGVIFCLIASLFEALVILPSHLAEWSKPLKSKEEDGDKSGTQKPSTLAKFVGAPFRVISVIVSYFTSHERKGSEAGWYKWLLKKYMKVLKFALNRKLLIALVCFFILVGTVIFSVKVMPIKLFPNITEIFYVQIELPEGSALEESNKAISCVEEIIGELPETELENIVTTVGYSGEIGQGPFDKYGSRFAQCIVYLTAESGRKRKANEIITGLRKKMERADIKNIKNLQFEEMQNGPPVGKPVAVSIKGDDIPTLRVIVAQVKDFMAGVDGIEDIKDDYELGKEEIQIHIDKMEAARLGLNVGQIASTVRFSFEGGVATSIRRGDEKIDIVVKLSEERKDDIKTLSDLTVPNSMGRLIKLNRVARFVKEQGMKTINHKEGKRIITVTANVDKKKITSVKANQKILNEFKDLQSRYPGYIMDAGGEWEDTTESVRSIGKAFGIAVLLIYLILATQFKSFIQPVIILLTVPFGFVGVVFALFIHGQPISLMAMFGMVGLTGVVVNDSLILMDFINKRREKGKGIIDAVMEAGSIRMRPILITSITTIVALMPVIYGIGGIEPFVTPAAIAMAYGLLVATFLTLVLVPCAYVVIERFREKLSRKK